MFNIFSSAEKPIPFVDQYAAQYGNFDNELLANIRHEVFGNDLGQNGWTTGKELELFRQWMELKKPHHLLDIACGSGGPTLWLGQKIGCHVTGLDLRDDAIKAAEKQVKLAGMEEQAEFISGDAAEKLPFDDAAFDAIICIDGMHHLPDRDKVLKRWRRVMKPSGKLLFVDPLVITGPVSGDEMRIRASNGYTLFVQPGYNETLLEEAGFKVEQFEDRTSNMAIRARRRLDIRGANEAALRKIEGDEAFESQQDFYEVVAKMAEDGRLSRYAYMAVRG